MSSRDWEKDWKWIESIAGFGLWEVSAFTVQDFGRYWLQRVRELEHVLEPLRYQDKEMLLKKIDDLKQTDGEDWAIGEVISRALEALEKEE